MFITLDTDAGELMKRKPCPFNSLRQSSVSGWRTIQNSRTTALPCWVSPLQPACRNFVPVINKQPAVSHGRSLLKTGHKINLLCVLTRADYHIHSRLTQLWKVRHLLWYSAHLEYILTHLVLWVALLPLVPSTHHSHHLSPLHSFTPGLKSSFSANPSHSSLSFLLQDWLHGLSALFTDTSEHIRFYFVVLLFSLLFSFWFHAVD